VTPDEFAAFLNSSALLCTAGAVLNLFLIRRRGTSAAMLAGAFLVLGLTLFGYAKWQSIPLAGAGGAFVFLLLASDWVLRMRRSG
jgi:hypothetical protein